jgi:hypothetical protein
MAGERQLAAGSEDPDRAFGCVVDEDGLGESEPGGNRLPALPRDGRAVEEDAERIAAAAVRPDEHPEDVDGDHLGPSAAPASRVARSRATA